MITAIAEGAKALFGIGSGIAQMVMGNKQRKRGDRLINQAESERVDYKAPQSTRDQLGEAKTRSYGKSSVQKLLESDAQEASTRYAGNVKANATSGSQALAMMAKGATLENEMTRKAQLAGEEDRQRKEEALERARGEMAKAEDNEYQLNVREPYLNKLTRGEQMVGAGTQNMFGGLNTIGGMLMNTDASNFEISQADKDKWRKNRSMRKDQRADRRADRKNR